MFKKLSLVVMLPVVLGGSLLSSSGWADTANEKKHSYPDKIPQLSSLVEEVLKTNPEIQSLEAERDAVIAKAKAANQPLYNPELELDIENTDIQTSSLGVSQAIDWSDKKGTRS